MAHNSLPPQDSAQHGRILKNAAELHIVASSVAICKIHYW